jgi:competence protein ComEC
LNGTPSSHPALRISLFLAFVLGVLCVQTLPLLPPAFFILVVAIATFASFAFRRPRLGAFLFGLLWAVAFATQRVQEQLPRELEGQDLTLEGRVAALPESEGGRVRFEFRVLRVISPAGVRVPGKLRLNWYDPKQVPRGGERWRLTVRLKRPHGMWNPGGMDYELWLFAQNLRAIGYVRDSSTNARLEPANPWHPAVWRQAVSERISWALPASPFQGVIRALVMGADEDIDSAQWEVLRRTGTAHLIAISGSHVSLIALLAYGVAAVLAASLHVVRWSPPRLAASAAILAALVYSALAGFAIPTLRALIMITIAMGAIIAQRNSRSTYTLALALAAVVLCDPCAVLAPGFWLSFGAVAFILYRLSPLCRQPGFWRGLLSINWATALGLAPLLLLFFGQISLIAPVANLFAVPVLGLLIIPLALTATLVLFLWPAAGKSLLDLVETLVAWAWKALEGLAQLPFAQWQHAPPGFPWILLGLCGATLLLLPRGIPGRWLGLFLLLPALTRSPEKIAPDQYRLTLLDVGQGLASVIETRHHTLVFDTGPRFSDRFDTGSAVIEPFLRHRGIDRIDTLVVSHGDNDHSGGAEALLQRIAVTAVLSSVPERFTRVNAYGCKAGQSWEWDGVRFEMLWPIEPSPSGNDGSCVLRVSATQGSALLTGDIGQRAETGLVMRYGDHLQSTVVVAPHHGSKTSSSPAFVAKVRPRIVLFPVGYRNRYGFPRAEVVERYRRTDASIWDTATGGAITVHSDREGRLAVSSYRQTHRRYWHDSPEDPPSLAELLRWRLSSSAGPGQESLVAQGRH